MPPHGTAVKWLVEAAEFLPEPVKEEPIAVIGIIGAGLGWLIASIRRRRADNENREIEISDSLSASRLKITQAIRRQKTLFHADKQIKH